MKKKQIYYSTSLVSQLREFYKKGISYIDALVEIQLKTDIEFEELVEMLPEYMVNLIKEEFINKKFRVDLNITDSKLKKKMENRSVDITKLLNLKK